MKNEKKNFYKALCIQSSLDLYCHKIKKNHLIVQ